MKRMLAAALGAVMITLCISGCGASIGTYSGPTPTLSAQTGIDYAAAFAAYEPEEVVMTVDGSPVTWEEYYHWIYYALYSMEAQQGEIADVNGAYPYGDGEQTYAGYAADSAADMCVQYHAMEARAAQAGVSLTARDQDRLADLLRSDIISVCGEGGTEEDFNAALETQYLSRELYDYMNEVTCLYSDCFTELFGDDGEKLEESDVMDFAAANGYVRVKHILISAVDGEGEALPEAERAEKLALARSLADRAAAETDSGAREELFTALMKEHSQDTGLAYFPDGYLYAPGTMAEDFETAAAALEEYQVSDPVETVYGYHVIMRLPCSGTDTVYQPGGQSAHSLRYLAALSAYDVMVGGWIADADIQWTDAFSSFDVARLLG